MNQTDIDLALVEFEYCVKQALAAKPDERSGRRYALDMAGAELQLLGVDPSTVTPKMCDSAQERLKLENLVGG